MGWAYCSNAQGREVGYGILATCDQEGCTAEIDRGLAYVCGGMHDGGDYGCGEYFCGEHLYMSAQGQLCLPCYEAYYADHDDEDDAHIAVCPACFAIAEHDREVRAYYAAYDKEHPHAN